MKLALITLSNAGARLLTRAKQYFEKADCFIHTIVDDKYQGRRFSRIADLSKELWSSCDGLVYAVPCGVVVRSIAPLIRHKHTDPAVVVLDAGGRYAISLLSGHEGGANALAFRIANCLGAEPVVTTTTDVLKTIIVGIGCRKGTSSEKIIAAVHDGLAKTDHSIDDVRLIASADIKSEEIGLIEAAKTLDVPLRFIESEEIRKYNPSGKESSFVQGKVSLPGVAEPVALLAGRRTGLLLPKTTYQGITIAIAKEQFL